MSLVSGYPGAPPQRKETGSTFSSSPDDREDNSSHQMASTDYLKGSAPASPSSDKHAVSRGVSRPPGMTGPLPSPIGKPGHSNNNSATSPLLTLTPNSSADGHSTSDWGRQSSPFHGSDGPTMPNLQAPGGGRGDNFGSFAINDGDNDGLLGLQALRDRAQSSPGPVVEGFPTSSPAGLRGHFTAHHLAGQQQEQDRSRPRERPPRSQPANGENSSVGGISLPFSSTSSVRSTDLNTSMDSNDSRYDFGAFARPELRLTASNFDPSRRRATSTDVPQNLQNPYTLQLQQQQQQQQASYMDPSSFSQKFGSLPSLGSHIKQQRVPVNPPESFADLHRPRHVRSVSQPMLPHQQQGQVYTPPGVPVDARYMPAPASPYGSSYHPMGAPRGTNMSHPSLSTSYDSAQYVQKMSMPNMQGYGHQQYPNLQRRDALDFPLGPNSQSSGGPMNVGAEEYRGYGAPPSMISPGQSPMQVHYGGHSRQASDGSAMVSTSSHMSHNGGMLRAQGGHFHGRQGGDDDLGHPLAGEHIEVPDELALSGSYGGNHGPSHPLMRGSGHAHSMSLGEMPGQYHDGSHRMAPPPPAAPKFVYAIKFKRTQRNFVLGPRISRDLKIGTYVKVEADRGEDLGIVVGKAPADKFSFPGRSTFSAGMGPPGGLGGGGIVDLKRVVRLATHDEVSLLTLKREEEDELLKICRAKVGQRGLPMHVVDAEYQFDRHKLTFFFEAEGRVDFRELVRDLFSMYKTRIWMQQLDKNTSGSNQAIMAPQTANMQMDFGVPIIAPSSEFADSVVLGGMSGVDR